MGPTTFTAVGAATTGVVAGLAPACALSFAPQHRTVPSASSAQVWPAPAATALTDARPGTAMGTAESAVDCGCPSWAVLFDPQHWTPPAVVTAHVWPTPAERNLATAPPASVTSTGASRSTVSPTPSCPDPLFPQHITPPAVVRTQAWLAPSATLP